MRFISAGLCFEKLLLSAAGKRCGCQMVSGLDTGLRGLGASPGQSHHSCSVLAYTMPLSMFIIHQIFRLSAIGLNTSHDLIFLS